MHGAGIIDGIEERVITEPCAVTMYLSWPAGGMLVMLPIDKL
jgi:RNA polymerase-interacting CarD/CdnL/TRCF family regulator